MLIRKIVFVILACSSLSAAAQIISLAHEVLVSDLRLPTYTSGTISFKGCKSCETQTVQVTENTQYFLNDVAYPLQEYSRKLALINGKDKTTATVMHHLESDTVTTVHVYRK